MVQAYQPPLMDVNQETLPELQPIFALLNSHSNKLYQEGYFLKLDDQDISTRSCGPAIPVQQTANQPQKIFLLTLRNQRANQTRIGHGPNASLS